MDKHTQLKLQLKKLIGADPNYPVSGVIKSVEEDTCTVELEEGFEVPDVKLKSTANGNDNLLIIPKVGSIVTLLSGDGTVDNLTVIKVDQASKIIFNENGLQIEIDSTDKKVSIKNSDASLFDLFTDLVNILKQFKVYTNMGPSGTALPDSVISITKLETDFKQLLK
ncbi:hypothetical protein SAMN05421796_11063 [Chryseobacterium piscicola]|uniref:Uncharacterized protein n=1 Tax=Chryseobacterium piscicola TaxID=551459 RepID=A0A1N7P1J9_9FLAO|nr:hypothetical protein [Chryseobacterium piscicola]PQA92753.1 hypothetical protein B0A70_10230 [Chryseobacterium piscicola]SIT04319.1 hypothetical protein SAMN05421796_11063 [Chryseobacterium piscicola]